MALASSKKTVFIPDFCSGDTLLPLLIISQMVAIVIVLAVPVHEAALWRRLLVVSLYLHWITLSSAAVLCYLRRFLGGREIRSVMLICWAVLLLVTLAISEAAYQVSTVAGIAQFPGESPHLAFVLRNTLICAIVSALALRYFYIIDAWQRQVHAVANARYQALQARIRPHFLFNSLNSIVALIPGRPDQAESMVEDLADLFRVILRTRKPLGTVADELELTRAYLRIEQLRLGPRLRVNWDLQPGLEGLPMPLLCLQPMVENGIYHGVELLDGGGQLGISLRRNDKVLVLEVENPTPGSDARGQGSRSAQDNIRQRLRLLFEDRARLTTSRQDGVYRARLEIPV